MSVLQRKLAGWSDVLPPERQTWHVADTPPGVAARHLRALPPQVQVELAQPRRAASIAATSISCIVSMASKSRRASSPPRWQRGSAGLPSSLRAAAGDEAAGARSLGRVTRWPYRRGRRRRGVRRGGQGWRGSCRSAGIDVAKRHRIGCDCRPMHWPGRSLRGMSGCDEPGAHAASSGHGRFGDCRPGVD